MTDTTLTVAIPLYERLTALDAVGPYEVLQRIPSIDVVFVGDRPGPVRTENGFLGLMVDARFDDVPTPDVVVVPGGNGCRDLLSDDRILGWLRHAHESTLFTTSVCTGSLLLAAAGLLTGRTATTHWAAYETLESLGATPVAERVVEHLDDRLITAAGVSAGIDMALRLVELLVDRTAAEAAQLLIEYDPHPPVNAGSLAVAGAEARERAAAYSGRA